MEIKVTREMLDKYRKLKQEIPVLELELLMMKNTESTSQTWQFGPQVKELTCKEKAKCGNSGGYIL